MHDGKFRGKKTISNLFDKAYTREQGKVCEITLVLKKKFGKLIMEMQIFFKDHNDLLTVVKL